jgi:hypothetical protein
VVREETVKGITVSTLGRLVGIGVELGRRDCEGITVSVRGRPIGVGVEEGGGGGCEGVTVSALGRMEVENKEEKRRGGYDWIIGFKQGNVGGDRMESGLNKNC